MIYLIVALFLSIFGTLVAFDNGLYVVGFIGLAAVVTCMWMLWRRE